MISNVMFNIVLNMSYFQERIFMISNVMFNIVLNMSYFQYVHMSQKGLLKRPQSQIIDMA